MAMQEGMTMAVVKTVVSIDKDVFDDAQRLATELHVSCSQLVTMALRRLVRAHENKALLAQLNASVDSMSDEEKGEEQAILSHMRQRHRAQLEGEW
jgi:thiazole synthase ThiGH ThiG subunit